MMTLINISKQLLKCAMLGIFACLLWLSEINEAWALNYSECRDSNFCRTHNLAAEHCTKASANDCSTQHCASGFNNGKEAIAKLQQKDAGNCLSQMPIQNVSGLNISAVVGVRTDTAALHPERGCKCSGTVSKCGSGCKKAVYSDGTRSHNGVDVGTGGVAGVKIYAPAQAFRAEVNAPRTAAGCAAYGDSSVTLHHKRGQTNKQKGCSEYWTRFYHVVNPQISAGTKDIPKGTWIADAGPCTGYAIHMHYEIHDCDGTLYSPTCLGEAGGPQQLCDPAANQLPPPNDADVSALYGDGTGGSSAGTPVNPYLSEIEDCCKYADSACQAQSSQGSQNSPASTPKAQQNDKIIFVGDSRTVGIAGAKGAPITGTKFPRTANGVGKDGNYWLAKEGAQISWLTSNKSTIDGLLPNYGTIVIALGVNDVTNQNNYIKTVNSYAQQWQAQGKKVYFSLVTGVDEQKEASMGYSVKNKDISAFNNALKSGLSGVSVIDATSVVGGANTGSDGLHYTSDGYDKLYNSFVSQVKSGGMGTGNGGNAGVADGSACSACKVKTEKQQQCERKNEAIRNGGIYCEDGPLSDTWQTDCLKDKEKGQGEKTNSGKKPDIAGQCIISVADSGSGCSSKSNAQNIPSNIQNAIDRAAAQYGISPIFLASFINLESNFNPNAKAKGSSAKGLGQIIDGTWKSTGCTGDPYNPDDNVMCMGKLITAIKQEMINAKKREPQALAALDPNDIRQIVYAYFQGGGGLRKVVRAGGENWLNYSSPQTSTNCSGKYYVDTVLCHMEHIADRNGCEGGSGLYASCPLPPGCKDYRFDAAGYAASQGSLFANGHTCNIAENYNSIKGCMFCNLFRVVYDAASVVARQCHNIFSSSMITLLAIGLAIVMAMIILKYVSNWQPQDWRQLVNELLHKIFLIGFLILLLRLDVTEFFNMFVTPVFNTGFKLASMIMGNDSCDVNAIGTVNGIGLPETMGQSMLCAIYAIQQRLEKMMALGSNAICIAFYIKSFHQIPIFPHFGYLLTGLFLWLAAIIFMLAYPFLLIDSVLQFGIASSLFPVAIASTGFKLTSKYLNIWKIVNIFASAMFNFIFLTTILFILLQGIDKAVYPIIERAYSTAGNGNYFDLNTIAWFSKQFVLIIFFIFLGKTVLEYIPGFADEYAKTITNGGSGTSKLGIGRKVGGTAANFVGQSAKWASGKAKDAASGAAHAKIFGKDGDEHSLADMFNGAQLGVGKQMQGTVTGVAYGLGRVAAAKFGGIRHKYLVNNTLKKMNRQQASGSQAASGSGSQAAMAQTVQGRTWWGQKIQRRVIQNPDGTMVLESSRKSLFRGREVTKLEDDHMSITQKTYKNGEIKESYDIKDPRLHNLIKEDGTRNQVKMDELMQNSSLPPHMMDKIILNQMLKQRLSGIDKTFGSSMVSMNGKFVSENVSSYLNEQGQKVFEVRRVDKKGNVNVYKMTQGQTRDLVEYERISANGDSVKLSSDGIIQRKEKGHYNLNQDGTLKDSTSAIVNGQEMSGLRTTADGIVRDQEGNVLGRIQRNGAITDLNARAIGTLKDQGWGMYGNVMINGAKLNDYVQKDSDPTGIYDGKGNLIGHVQDNGNIVDANKNVIGTAEKNQMNEHNSTLMINGAEVKGWTQKDGLLFDKEGNVIGQVLENGNVVPVKGVVQQTDLAFGLDGRAIGKRTIHGTIIDDSGVIVGRIGDDGKIIGMNNQVVGAMSAQEQESLEQMRSDRKSEFSNSKVFKGVDLFDHNGNKLIDDEIMFDTSATDLYRHQMNYYGDVLSHKEFGR